MMTKLMPFSTPIHRGDFALRLLAYVGFTLITRNSVLVAGDAWAVVLAPIWLFFTVFYLASVAGRLIDVGWTRWLVLVLFVPLVNIALVVALVARPGQPEASVRQE